MADDKAGNEDKYRRGKSISELPMLQMCENPGHARIGRLGHRELMMQVRHVDEQERHADEKGRDDNAHKLVLLV